MSNSKIPEMFYSDSFETFNGIHINVKTFKNYQLHRHEFYEFEYVIEGEGECEVNGKSFSFSKGDILFVTPFDVHGYKSDNLFKMLTIHFCIDNLTNDLTNLTETKACIMKSTKEMEETLVNELLRLHPPAKDFETIIAQVEKSCEYLKENAALFEILVRYHVDRDLENMVINVVQHYASHRINPQNKEMDDSTAYLVSAYLYAGCYALLREWLLRDIDKTPREIAELLVDIASKDYL